MSIEIEKDVPLPPRRTSSAEFPFDKMEVGDSFFIPDTPSRVFSAKAHNAGLRLGYKFSVRNVEGGCRCWRIN